MTNRGDSLSAETKRPQFFYGYIIVLAAFVIYAITFGIITAFGVFFKPLLTELGWTRAITAGASSLHLLMAGFLGIFMGRLTDKFGPRILVMTLGSFLGLGCLLMSRVSSIWQLYLFWGVIASIGTSTALVPITATIARWFAKRRGLMMGIVTAGGAGIGGMIMSPVSGWCILAYDWRFSYIIVGTIALVFIILSGQFLKRDPNQLGQSPYGVSEVKEPELKKQSSSLQGEGFLLQEAIRTRQFWMLEGIFFSYGFCRGTILVHIVAHATDLGFSLTTGAYILAIITAVSAASGIGMGRIADSIGNRPALTISFIITAIILFWATVAKELWMLYLFAVIYGFGRGGREVVRFSLTSELFGLSSLGIILGTINFGDSIGTAIGPLLAGVIFDVTGNYNLAFLILAAIAVIGCILVLLLTPPRRREANYLNPSS